jgi:hypothetical protein
MQALEKRIESLERASRKAGLVFFVILEGMGEADRELTYLYDNHGNQWSREPSETELEFRERATSQTPRTENQVAILFSQHLPTGADSA